MAPAYDPALTPTADVPSDACYSCAAPIAAHDLLCTTCEARTVRRLREHADDLDALAGYDLGPGVVPWYREGAA